jgi:pimeloyl-ACP methyl ester carboxylesterase
VTATVVLVHGAWHGAWCWEKVIGLLDDAGVPSVALDLPGHGDSTEPLCDLAGDAAALRRVLDGLDDVIVCAHSYGGVVASEGAAGHPGVRHLVFISSFPVDVGESATSAATNAPDRGVESTELANAMVSHGDGTSSLDPSVAPSALYADCDDDDAAKATARLCRQSWAELQGVATRAAWKDIPSTYVVCTQDRAVPPALQHVLARRCTRTLEWPTSHSPFLSRPELVADLLVELATA